MTCGSHSAGSYFAGSHPASSHSAPPPRIIPCSPRGEEPHHDGAAPSFAKAGFTLLEMLLVLGVTGLLLAMAVGEGARLHDGLAVHLSREEVVGLIAEARMAARVYGGASLVVEDGGSIALMTGAGEVLRHWSPAAHRVSVTPGTRRTPVELHFGPTGLGRATSVTLSFRRGQTDLRLVLSSYGRVRRDG